MPRRAIKYQPELYLKLVDDYKTHLVKVQIDGNLLLWRVANVFENSRVKSLKSLKHIRGIEMIYIRLNVNRELIIEGDKVGSNYGEADSHKGRMSGRWRQNIIGESEGRQTQEVKAEKDAQGQTITKTQQEAVTRKMREVVKKKENPRDSGEMIKIETSRKLNKVQHHDKGLCRKLLLFSFFLKESFQISWK